MIMFYIHVHVNLTNSLSLFLSLSLCHFNGSISSMGFEKQQIIYVNHMIWYLLIVRLRKSLHVFYIFNDYNM